MKSGSARPESRVILVVDDSDEDFFFLECALEKTRLPHRMFHVRDGAEALKYLEGEGRFHDRHRFPKPDMMILDLKMPVMDGFELLEVLGKELKFTDFPVLVLSGSNLPEDEAKALELGARSYHVKCCDSKKAVEAIREVCDKYFGT